MRISELARRTDVAVGTIKFYLREGLLPPGTLTSATQAQYDEQHVERLRLIRALVVGAGLPLAATRLTLELIDHPPSDITELFGQVQELLSPAEPVDTARARELVETWGWHCDPTYDAVLRRLAVALNASDAADFAIPDGVLDAYARAMYSIAEVEIAHTPQGSVLEAVRYTVLGSVLMESVLLAIRRLAEADVAVRILGRPEHSGRSGHSDER